MLKQSILNREVDLVLLSIEMTKQARHVQRCWSIIKQLQQARMYYPEEISISLGFYRTVFDSLVTSVFIGLGKLYDQSGDSYSLYALQQLLGGLYGISEHASALKNQSQSLRALFPKAQALRQWRNKQYAHNAQEIEWDRAKLDSEYPLKDEDIESLIAFACEYCDFFSLLAVETPFSDCLPPCNDLENTLQRLHAVKETHRTAKE